MDLRTRLAYLRDRLIQRFYCRHRGHKLGGEQRQAVTALPSMLVYRRCGRCRHWIPCVSETVPSVTFNTSIRDNLAALRLLSEG
jgi:hypothetical protein